VSFSLTLWRRRWNRWEWADDGKVPYTMRTGQLDKHEAWPERPEAVPNMRVNRDVSKIRAERRWTQMN